MLITILSRTMLDIALADCRTTLNIALPTGSLQFSRPMDLVARCYQVLINDSDGLQIITSHPPANLVNIKNKMGSCIQLKQTKQLYESSQPTNPFWMGMYFVPFEVTKSSNVGWAWHLKNKVKVIRSIK